MPILLDREQAKPRTATGPVLNESPRGQVVGGPPQDSSIVVIENPSEGQVMGLLFSRQFQAGSDKARTLRSVDHFRIDTKAKAIVEHSIYNAVQVKADTHRMFGKYEYLETGDQHRVLPNPSAIPYEVAFFDPGAYEQYLRSLRTGNVSADALVDLNLSLAAKVNSFKISAGNLVLPENYAALTRKELGFS